MIPLILFTLLLVALGLCFTSNRDIFSPGKFYHAYLVVFFADVFLSEHSGYVYAIYSGFVLSGMLISLIEAYALSRCHPPLTCPESLGSLPSRFIGVLWILSVLPVLLQLYLIHITGGFASLARVVTYRVVEWQGLGHLLLPIRLMGPLNLVYFTVGIVYAKRHSGPWWFLYGLHLLLSIISALLLGGRGGALMRVVSLMLVYNYLRRPIKFRYAVVAGTTLLIIACFLGTVRNNLTRVKGVDDLMRLRGKTLNRMAFSYGTIPLDLVFSQEFADYQYGKTFLTVVTHYVPRGIWQQKPDSGGVVLTKFRDRQHYRGLGNLSPGVVTESILNFGYPLGVLLGFVFLLLAIVIIVHVYACFRRHCCTRYGLSRVYLVLLYVCMSQLVAGALFGEAWNISYNLVRNILGFSIIILLLRVRVMTPCRKRHHNLTVCAGSRPVGSGVY